MGALIQGSWSINRASKWEPHRASKWEPPRAPRFWEPSRAPKNQVLGALPGPKRKVLSAAVDSWLLHWSLRTSWPAAAHSWFLQVWEPPPGPQTKFFGSPPGPKAKVLGAPPPAFKNKVLRALPDPKNPGAKMNCPVCQLNLIASTLLGTFSALGLAVRHPA